MKKLLIIILAVLLLAGCSTQPAEQEPPLSEPEITASDSPSQSPVTIAPNITENSSESSAAFPPASESPEQASDTAQPPSETPPYSPEPEQTPEESPVLDKYLTEPVPEGKPAPVEPQDVTTGDTAYTCTLSVRCDTILDNIGDLDPEKLELVPEDGVIFAAQEVTFYEGESVFNVLQREMKRAKIHMEFRNTPIYNSAYIMGINNLYEFDCGPLSGWMYKVNDWFPNYGCSRYQLQDGDVVEWIYTCDLGRGYGLPGRTAFSIYCFDSRDRIAFLYLLFCGGYIIIGAITKGLYFRYFPTIKGVEAGPYPISLFAVYFALCIMPFVLNVREDLRWIAIESKI